MTTIFYPLPELTQKTEKYIISSYTITRVDVVPNTCAYIFLQLYAPNNTGSGNLSLQMEGEAYQAWTDDSYLLNWINQQIYERYPIPE